MKTPLLPALLLGLCVTPALAVPPSIQRSLDNAVGTEAQGLGTVLFDGTDLSAWEPYGGGAISDKWTIDGDALHLAGRGGGDLMTKQSFGDFDLSFEWKVAEGSNSGVMYRVEPIPGKPPYHTGPEYQVLDDAVHRDGKNPKTSAAAIYALVAPEGKTLEPVGRWNTGGVRMHDGKLQHLLNGAVVAEFDTTSPEWEAMIADSKFKDWPQFATKQRGRIVLQDHGDPVWFRNIRIRELR